MTPITILQSAADTRPDWVSRCMRSVADWSQRQGYGYHCIGDELFDWVTPELRTKLHDRTPILADLVRLRWIESELAARRSRGLDRCRHTGSRPHLARSRLNAHVFRRGVLGAANG